MIEVIDFSVQDSAVILCGVCEVGKESGLKGFELIFDTDETLLNLRECHLFCICT